VLAAQSNMLQAVTPVRMMLSQIILLKHALSQSSAGIVSPKQYLSPVAACVNVPRALATKKNLGDTYEPD
jgi:hypothetical protein